ncbi:MAG: hypothetical protein IKW99_03495 [Bacteroidales bacterium]|nr:hypothetical protein [Bacteroidales bacterium]
MAETVVYTPENQANSIPAWMAMNNGGLFGNSGWGGGILGFLLGLFFGNGWGGWGNGFGGFGGGNSGAGFLSNQINNDSGRELLMNAITSQGEAGRAATQNLATMLGQDYGQVSSAIAAIQSALSTLALQQAVSVPQIINSIQSGDAALASQLAQCCCENRLLTTQQGYESRIATIEQTNVLNSSILGSGQKTVDAIADLKTSMVSEFCAAKERDMQAKIDTQSDIITQLRNQLDNDRQTAQFTALLAPIQAQVNTIASKQINTVPVAWPNLQAVNTTPYVNGGYYGSPFGFGNGVTF